MSLEQNITLDRKTIFRMLIPVLIDQLFITLLPIVNTVVVSALGQSSMSGVSIVDQINQLISFTVVAIGMGGAVMAAQYTGRGDRNGVARVVKQSYSSSFLVTIVVTVVVIVFASPIISVALSGADDEMKSIAYSYLLITCFSYPFYGFYSNTTQILRGIGRPREAMVTSVVMNTAIFVINAACIYVLELGIIGAVIVCMLYIVLLFRTATIANRCTNTFPALLIMGFAMLLVVQALFNMAVAVGLVPVTGQPLPLISKGGTSTIINCVYIGVILSVSHSAKKKDKAELAPEPAVAA